MLLTEAKFGLNDLKKFGYKLYVEDNSNGEITIYLIDDENSTHGVIVTEVIGSSKSTVHEVVRVAADGGWGPLMYEAAMAYFYPQYIKPSGYMTSTYASAVWEKFFNRDDVEKLKIDYERLGPRAEYLNTLYRKKNPILKNRIVDISEHPEFNVVDEMFRDEVNPIKGDYKKFFDKKYSKEVKADKREFHWKENILNVEDLLKHIIHWKNFDTMWVDEDDAKSFLKDLQKLQNDIEDLGIAKRIDINNCEMIIDELSDAIEMAYNTDNDKNLNKLIKEYVKELIEALRDLIWNVKNLRK